MIKMGKGMWHVTLILIFKLLLNQSWKQMLGNHSLLWNKVNNIIVNYEVNHVNQWTLSETKKSCFHPFDVFYKQRFTNTRPKYCLAYGKMWSFEAFIFNVNKSIIRIIFWSINRWCSRSWFSVPVVSIILTVYFLATTEQQQQKVQRKFQE